jgi:hypothetical protein
MIYEICVCLCDWFLSIYYKLGGRVQRRRARIVEPLAEHRRPRAGRTLQMQQLVPNATQFTQQQPFWYKYCWLITTADAIYIILCMLYTLSHTEQKKTHTTLNSRLIYELIIVLHWASRATPDSSDESKK